MNQARKKELAKKANEWVWGESGRTKSELARKTGVSVPYMTNICNGKWDDKHPSAAQWQKLEVFFREPDHIDSVNYMSITGACNKAHALKSRIAIDGYTGAGKTYSLTRYVRKYSGAYLIICRSSMTNRSFLEELSRCLGISKTSSRIYQIERAIIEKVMGSQEDIVLIFDEVEYLKPGSLNSLKTIMQELKGHCGFVVSGIIKEWLTKMAFREKPGMPQFLRRIGHSWVSMEAVSKEDVVSICQQKEIKDKNVVRWLYHNCKEYDALLTYVQELHTVAIQDHVKIDVELCGELFG